MRKIEFLTKNMKELLFWFFVISCFLGVIIFLLFLILLSTILDKITIRGPLLTIIFLSPLVWSIFSNIIISHFLYRDWEKRKFYSETEEAIALRYATSGVLGAIPYWLKYKRKNLKNAICKNEKNRKRKLKKIIFWIGVLLSSIFPIYAILGALIFIFGVVFQLKILISFFELLLRPSLFLLFIWVIIFVSIISTVILSRWVYADCMRRDFTDNKERIRWLLTLRVPIVGIIRYYLNFLKKDFD